MGSIIKTDSEKSKDRFSFEGMRLLKIVRRDRTKNTRILLTAAPKALVRKYLTLFREAGLTLLALDTEAFSLVRSLVGADPATVMLVDLDFTVTNIMIVQNGIPYLNRSINVGGLTITKAIASALNVNLDRADLEARRAAGETRLSLTISALKITSTHLSSAQLGITLTTLLTGYTLEPAFSSFLRPPLTALGLPTGVVSVGGRSLFEYGDLGHLSYLASVRKSILAILYGKYVENGTIDLTRTLADLGFTDVGGLEPRELEAKILDLVTARSGVYHLASNAGDDTASAPPRGSQPPGTYYLYNNWDFNVAGRLFERLTKTNIFHEFERAIARPIGMEDYRVEDGQYVTGRDSVYPAYPLRLTARDMARFGLLFLRKGRWGWRQVVPADWVTESVTSYSDAGNSGGYGYMWEYPITRAYADARVQRIYGGTNEIMKEVITRAMGLGAKPS